MCLLPTSFQITHSLVSTHIRMIKIRIYLSSILTSQCSIVCNENHNLNVLLKQSSLLCKQLEVHVNCLEMVQTCCVVCAFVYKIPPSSHCLFMFMFIPWFDLILFRSSITLKGLFTSKHNMHLNKSYHRNKDQLKGEEEGGSNLPKNWVLT